MQINSVAKISIWKRGAVLGHACLLVCVAGNAIAQVRLPPSIDAGAIQRQTIDREQQIREDGERPKLQSPLEKIEPVVKKPQKSDVRFLLKRIEFSPSEILKADELLAYAKEFEGREVTLAELEGLLEKINQRYRELGVITASAVLPPQDIVDGVVRIRLIEGRIGKVSVEGNLSTRTEYIEGWIKQHSGELPDLVALERDLIRFNRTNDAQLAAILKPGEKFGQSDIQVNVAEPPLHDVRMFMDNSGSPSTGEFRTGVSYLNRSLLGFRDNLGLSFIWSDGHNGYGVNYSLPVNTWGTRLVGAYNLDKTDIKHGPFKDLGISGEAQAYSLDLRHPLYFDNRIYLEAIAGFRNRQVSSWINDIFLQRTDTNDGHAGLEWQSVDSGGFWTGSLTYISGDADFSNAAGKRYSLTRGSIRRVQDFGRGWQLRGIVSFQGTPDVLLPSSEQFMIGGEGTVRGYKTGLYSGDSGHVLGVELHHPLPLGIDNVKTSGFFFVDRGVTKPYRPVGSQLHSDEITGAGWGLNLGISTWLSTKLSLGYGLSNRPEETRNYYVNAQVVIAAF